MRKSYFIEAQSIGMIRKQDTGRPTPEVCRKHGLSQGTFYTSKSTYGGRAVSNVAKRDQTTFKPSADHAVTNIRG